MNPGVQPNLDPSQSQLGGLGKCCNLPSGIWGGTPVARDLDEFSTERELLLFDAL